MRGTPALAFGNAWYFGCKSVHKINTLDDAKNAIKKICDGWKPDTKDVDRYAASVEKVAKRGLIIDNFDEKIEKSNNPQIELKKIADSIFNAHQKYFQ